MTADIKTWQRPNFEPDGRTAEVIFYVFADRALDLASPMSRSRHGIPGGFSPASLDIRQHLLQESPDWFEGFFSPEMLGVANAELSGQTDALVGTTAVYSVSVRQQEPEDLAYLQGAWAAAKWLCERGALFVHDAHPIRWHAAGEVNALAPDRAFEIRREVNLVFETDPSGDFGHLCHTRGLAKFARPDIVLLGAAKDDAPACGALLNGLASRAASGAALAAGQTVAPTGLPRRTLAEYLPGVVHPEVHLNNDGLVLDIRGWGLPSPSDG